MPQNIHEFKTKTPHLHSIFWNPCAVLPPSVEMLRAPPRAGRFLGFLKCQIIDFLTQIGPSFLGTDISRTIVTHPTWRCFWRRACCGSCSSHPVSGLSSCSEFPLSIDRQVCGVLPQPLHRFHPQLLHRLHHGPDHDKVVQCTASQFNSILQVGVDIVTFTITKLLSELGNYLTRWQKSAVRVTAQPAI